MLATLPESWRTAKLVLLTLVVLASTLAFTRTADAIPVFSRKYRTSCITCHAGFPKLNSVGEAFRRNGYQFPTGDYDLVKDEPISLGSDRMKDLWPNSIWPNDIPHLPPVSFRGRFGFNVGLDGDGDPNSDFRFPMDYSLLSAGTLGENISWYAGFVLSGKGGHGGGGGHGGAEETNLEPELERYFVQFSNLFAWSDEDDDDGMREANRWLALPPHAMNLRLGQFEPGVVAPWGSIHRQLGIQARLPNVATIGGNSFAFEPALRGIELHGVFRNYWSYSVGLVNGTGTGRAWDNNSAKDYYARVARKWWGYPLDGRLGSADIESEAEVGARRGPRSSSDYAVVRGQNDDDGFEVSSPGLDFWRETSFETGVFGYFGRNLASVTVESDVMVMGTDENGDPVTITLEDMVTTSRIDRFQRVGFDARWQHRDWDVFGAWVWGWHNDPISDEDPMAIESDTMFTWFVEVDYYFKPWLIGFARYEELDFANDERQEEAGIARGVVGASAYIRTNVRVVTEVVIDANNNGTTNDTLQFLLDLAY